MSSTIKISKFERTFSVPSAQDMTWESLVAMLSVARRTPYRQQDGECWSPATFNGAARTTANVDTVSLLVLDVDAAANSRIVEMRAHLARYQHLIHASYADRPDARHLRVVVRLSRAVSRNEWPQFWLAAVHQLQIPADLACRDAARGYFLPSRPSDADYFVEVHDGEVLDVDATLASVPLPVDPVAPIAAHQGVIS